jgi:hypothetical protein
MINRSILVIASAMLAACASSSTTASQVRDQAATVVVDNQSVLDMNIYAIRGGQRVRLGTANSLRKTKLTIPASMVFGTSMLRFLADPIGSTRAPISEEISVTAGDEIGLMIPPA